MSARSVLPDPMVVAGCERLWPRLAWVCDALIPADPAGRLPSARAVFEDRPLLQRALVVRSDLASSFFEVIEDLPEESPADALGFLGSALSTENFELVSQLIAGAYFLEPAVNEGLGYPGQGALPLEPDYDEIFELIEDVQARGPRFVEPPA